MNTSTTHSLRQIFKEVKLLKTDIENRILKLKFSYDSLQELVKKIPKIDQLKRDLKQCKENGSYKPWSEEEKELNKWITTLFHPLHPFRREIDHRIYLNTYGLENAKDWNKKVFKLLDEHWGDTDAFTDQESLVYLLADNKLEEIDCIAPELDKKIFRETYLLLLCLRYHLNPEGQALGIQRSVFHKAINHIQEHGNLKDVSNQVVTRFSDLVDFLYVAIANNDMNREMEVKRDAYKGFGVRADEMEKKCFELLKAKALGHTSLNFKRKKRSNVRLRHKGVDWKLTGFLPANDVSLLWGMRGAGKTRLAIEMAYAVMNGKAFLDRQTECAPSQVLFIASDSGLEPLEEELESCGLEEAFSEHKNWNLWCFNQETQQEGWGCNLKGRVDLYEWAKEHKGGVVIQDSAKSICSKGGIDYANNADVTEYMTFLKETIAPYVSILVLAHDGTRSNRAGGAGAWEEIPSMVMSCSRIKDPDGKDIKNKRFFQIQKSRKADERSFFYEIGEDGRLKTCMGTEVIGDVKGLIFKYMTEESDKGKTSASVAEILQGVKRSKPFTSRGTVTNNLSNMTRGKTPQLARVKNKKGVYKINPYYLRSKD